MKREDLEAMPLGDINMMLIDASKDSDDYKLAHEVLNRRLKPVSREFRVRPVLHWEVTDYTAKDGGRVEFEAGRGVHFALFSAVSSAHAMEVMEASKDGVDQTVVKPIFPRFQANHAAFADLEKAVAAFNKEIYGEDPPRECVHRAK